MGDNNIHDTLEVMVSVIAYAAAVTIVILAVSIYIRNLNFLSGRVDEKQSIETAIEQEIEPRMELSERDVLTKAQVLDTIIAVQNAELTAISIGGHTINSEDIKMAKEGDERGVKAILSELTNDNYERKNIYDTDNGKDYLSAIEFIPK